MNKTNGAAAFPPGREESPNGVRVPPSRPRSLTNALKKATKPKCCGHCENKRGCRTACDLLNDEMAAEGEKEAARAARKAEIHNAGVREEQARAHIDRPLRRAGYYGAYEW